MYTMCLQAGRKGWLFLIKKDCFTFTQSSKRKSRKSLFKCVDGRTFVLKWFFFIIIIYGVKRKEKKKQNEHCVYELGTQKSLLNTDCWYIEWCLLCYNFYQIIDSKCWKSPQARLCALLYYSTWTDLAEEMVQTPASPSFEADVTSLMGK